MAITLPNGFIITNQQPVDSRLVLSKAEMKAAVDARMPQVYMCVCKDDGKIYIYNVSNAADNTTGKFRLFEGGANYTAGSNIQISSDNVISATDTVYNDTEVRGLISQEATARQNADTALQNADALMQTSIEGLQGNVATLQGNITTLQGNVTTLQTNVDKKQEKLTAGTNITIDENNVISAVGGGAAYTAGDGISIDVDTNVISAKLNNGLETKFGGIAVKAADKSIEVGDLGVNVRKADASLSVTDNGLKVNQEVIQGKLTAGDNITISEGNVISASIDLTNYATLADLQIGKEITVGQTIGGITAGTVYEATTKMAKILEDLLGGSAPAPTGTKLYYGQGTTVPENVSGLTPVSITADDLKNSGYTLKNLTLNNEYVFLAVDKGLGVECYEILQNGFALGFNTVDLGTQVLYYPDAPATDTGVRLVYHFE